MNNKLSRTDYEHIPEHIRITGKYINPDAKPMRPNASRSAGRKPGGDNKGRGMKKNVLILLDGKEVCVTTSRNAAEITGLSYKSVLDYLIKNRVSSRGFSFKRV